MKGATNMNEELKELKQTVLSLQTEIEAQDGIITKLEKDIGDLQLELQALSSEVTTLNQKATSGN